MKTVRVGWIVVFLLCSQMAAFAQVSAKQPHAERRAPNTASSGFEPLDLWKAAVVSGDKSALAALYMTFPPVQVKTPQGQTQDPSEEPAYWSSLRRAGLIRFEPKVLEVKNLQPGVKRFVLRYELKFQTPTGEKSALIEGSQVWLQKLGEWRIAATQRSEMAENAPRRLPEPAKPNVDLYHDPAQAPAEIAAALAAASKDHKRVILVFGGNWCYDCHVLDATFRSRQIAPLVDANYHVVHVNVGDYDKNLDLTKKYEIPLEKGVPSLAVLDPDGTLIVSQKKGEFESTTRIGPEDVLGFLKKWKPQHAG
jgi:thioredoxin 1